MTRSKNHIESFRFRAGQDIAGKYEIMSRLGAGWEGEVYLIREHGTRIERAAKFFFPQRNKGAKLSNWYARKLHKLQNCPILIQYHNREQIEFNDIPVIFLVSEYVEGELLSSFLKRQRGKRISVFQAIHLLHALAVGVESVHKAREYHGDLHADNVIIRRHGLGFDLKVLDLYHWGRSSQENMQADICDMIRLFYDAIGGKSRYSNQPKEVKEICCGLRRSLITEKFRTARKLREHLEGMHWS